MTSSAHELEGIAALTASGGASPSVTIPDATSFVLRRLFGMGFAFVLLAALASALILGRRQPPR